MSNRSVTPPMRAVAWNVQFLAGNSDSLFSGIFQAPSSSFAITFRNVLDEMRLCFEMPHDDNNDDEDLAFSFAGFVNAAENEALPQLPGLITNTDLNRPVPSPRSDYRSDDASNRRLARFRMVRHRPCSVAPEEPLAAHITAGCANHIAVPTRRYEPRYLPPKKASPDTRFTAFPLRKTARMRRTSQSPSKRSASGSGSVSPSKRDDEDEAVDDMVAPPKLKVAETYARQTIASFRASCLVNARKCAISDRGKSWCISPAHGPALQACHIVPQQHYHVYPVPGFSDDGHDDLASPRRLAAAWQRTWSPENGILLLSHLHELFDMRLVSIHPDALRVRAFVPYDVLLDYHGRIATVPEDIDRMALRHHYDMCCIENMAAKMPYVEQLPTAIDSALSGTSGVNSPLSGRSSIPDLSRQAHQMRQKDETAREPSRRSRPFGDDVVDCPGMSSDDARSSSDEALLLAEKEVRGRKRQRLDSDLPYDRLVTPESSVEFWADVNWELGKLVRHTR
ncbi:hypothetical protein QQX98_005660 [Neonectria punicea]|uniref:HNH nuclease domain-containing protein n=1 Tax=Neonectria punicea TaxID=979145 RepID=A0ABR1H445_9HYPO